MITITPDLKIKMKASGISTLHTGPFSLPPDCVFEPPCSIKWMQVHWRLALGAFSYAVNGYYFGANIGRYTSIGENVSVGRGSHPVKWASTSPVFYQRHEDVVDFAIPEASNYRVTAPHIDATETHIGSDVYIGHGAFIMQGIKIGNGAVIGAQSVVTKDVPDYAVVAGSPAVIRKMRFPDAIIERMIRVAWWQYAFWEFPDPQISEPMHFLDRVEAKISAGLQPYSPKLIRLEELLTEFKEPLNKPQA